jgi:ATP-dependent 26S proteasome regulatory subunit
MSELMEQIQTNYKHMVNMSLFNKFKTNDPIVDALLSTCILSFIGYFFTYIYENYIDRMILSLTYDDIINYFYKKNEIIIEGKRSTSITAYSSHLNTSSMYSDRFKAIWNYIIENIENNNTIYCIKETHSNFQSGNNFDERNKNVDIFMVSQYKHFTIDKDIHVKATIEQEESSDKEGKINAKTDKIIITIYSYKHSVSYLKNYIDNITKNYLASIKDVRTNKKFIYFLEKTAVTEDETFLDCWREDQFESARTFNNIFFDGKKEIIAKIDHFLNNRDWYYQKGIPYSLGIGLHGPPGTGKTSFIKALANYTNRHVIVISLKIIKSKRQLEKFFFENTYNDNNEDGDIKFDKKIIVFEDIDCIGDVVLDRNLKNKEKGEKDKQVKLDTVSVGEVLQSICELNESGTTKSTTSSSDEPITLDDILNLWDGIRETPGRILVISSNHYDKLDPALIRPGRIDITHELSNASHNVILEMYEHLFEKPINKELLQQVQEYLYSPAEIINMYVSYKNEEAFMNRLLENRK